MFRSPKDMVYQSKPKEIDEIITDDGYNCDLCNSGPYSTEFDVEIHRRSAHKWEIVKALKDDDVAICSICFYIQKDKESLVQHILTDHLCSSPDAKVINREIFVCDYCDHLFFNKDLLIAHIYHFHVAKEIKKVSNIRHNCPKCMKLISAKSTWFHLLSHGVINSRVCPICLKCFNRNAEVLNHVKTHKAHLRCNICGFVTMKEIILSSHLKKHRKDRYFTGKADVSKYFVPCRLFPSTRKQSHVMKGIPMASEESGEVKHMCTCGMEFPNTLMLKHHVMLIKSMHEPCGRKRPNIVAMLLQRVFPSKRREYSCPKSDLTYF
ncbi:hypothetical protein HF086_009800 [Spodoptera exigua]|uniref:C2H2-type domain-containing protein n=1 Tax=Spodoptera exigua TaxID=7107 RepID=A0A922S7W7_SPOEX|nr:hypothetical protein HF086_009800 [Spodoptera exigua]